MKEEKIGGFMNPFNLEFGYGAVVTFWGASNINFAFATLKLSGQLKENTAAPFNDATFLETERMNYYMHYGLGVITAINKPIGKHLLWLNNSRMFLNGIDKDHVNFDLNNMLVVKVWKYFQIRIDTRWAYNPLLNYKLQFRQEVLLGFFYERNK